MAAFPATGRGLGLGLDLRYGDPHGLQPMGDAHTLSRRLRRFLAARGGEFGYAFFSFQPRDRGLLDLADYAPTWDRILGAPGVPGVVALHHTLLNLGSVDARVDRGRLLLPSIAFAMYLQMSDASVYMVISSRCPASTWPKRLKTAQ